MISAAGDTVVEALGLQTDHGGEDVLLYQEPRCL